MVGCVVLDFSLFCGRDLRALVEIGGEVVFE